MSVAAGALASLRRLPRKGTSAIERLRLALLATGQLLRLPFALRTNSLPALVRRLSRRPDDAIEPDRRRIAGTVRIVSRISECRVFDLPIFPRLCLRRSLALYAILAREGHPISIHFGVRADGGDLDGHSWLTVDGRPIEDPVPGSPYRTVYSYSSRATQ